MSDSDAFVPGDIGCRTRRTRVRRRRWQAWRPIRVLAPSTAPPSVVPCGPPIKWSSNWRRSAGSATFARRRTSSTTKRMWPGAPRDPSGVGAI